MTERNVTVRLRMVARDYISGGTEAERMSRRVAAAQQEMAKSSRAAGDAMDRSSRQTEAAGRRTETTSRQYETASRRYEAAGRRYEAAGRRHQRGMLYAAAGVAALGAAGGAIKILPGVLSATAVAGAALPPMLLGTAQAGGVLITSLKGVGKASGEVLKSDDPFAGLGRNARAVVAEVKRLQPAMSGFRQGLQDRTLDNAARNLNALATDVLPRVRGSLFDLADDWDEAFTQITASVMDPSFTAAFRTAGAGADWFFDLFNARIPATVRSISTLVTSADPLARAFGQGLINSLDRFNAKVERAARSGSLEEYFRRGAEGAGLFMDIAGDVLALTGMVMSEVQAQGGTLADTAASLDRYIASGRASGDVAGIVHTLTTAYEGLRDVLGPLGAIARDALADPATADALRTMFDVLAAGSRVLQVVFGLFQGLPDTIQGTVLVLIAGAVVAGKLTKALGLMQGAADRAATSLGRTGVAGERAGRGLRGAAAGAGKAAAALVGLQVAGAVLDQFDGSAPNVEALGRALEEFGQKGKIGGELDRLFGNDFENMGKIAGAASDRWLPKLGRSIEALVPPVKNLNEIFQGGSWTGSVERIQALDAELAAYARTTGDLTGAQDLWNQAFNASGLDMVEFAKLLPSSTAELDKLRASATTGAAGMAATGERAKLMGGSFREAALAGKDLATTMDLINGKTISAVEGQIRLEDAYDTAKDVVDEYGRVTKKGTNEINLGTEAGRKSMEALIGIQKAATEAADAEVKRTGDTQAGIPILNSARDKFIELATKMTGSAAAATALAGEIFKIPDKDVKVDAKTEDAIAKLRDAGYEVKVLPDGKVVIVGAKTDEAKRRLAEAKAAVDRINNKTVTVTVRTKIAGGSLAGSYHVSGPGGSGTLTKDAKGGVHLPRAQGGYSVPYGRPIAAASGLVRPDIYPASDPPLYQFAERETGGELFLPRKGIDRERGRALLAIAASWYGGMFMPMRRGGVRAAASGLVNVEAAPVAPSPITASRLDYAQAYLRARDAVAALSAALKENGRSFALSTAKGRENRSAVYAAIQAAQDAARTKYDETGSVKAANKAYDEHIARLRATLKQQKVNASTINSLLALAQRPDFTTSAAPAAPSNSGTYVAWARADIAANAGFGDLADRISLNRPGVDVGTEGGRDNLAAVLDFLGLAETGAQSLFSLTGNAGEATARYNGYLAQLRAILAKAGWPSAMIDSVIRTYGRITLQRNERGGVYMAAGGGLGMLGAAAIYPGGAQPMYGWAEKSTGGELFVPRLGERARGERLLAVGAGWYGGRYVPAGQSSGGQTTVNNSLTVNNHGRPLTLGELQGHQRQLDARARVGRKG
ncbi:hypothetical protein ACIBTV_27410 [Micromonospora sp. NPDC049366]|uniref:hypothetical protein n=1 Tax=Micromonospora sp. NPDC049366 TaxID=3364271 RepID=UPI0037AAE9C0